jgi:hypothetical protein
MVHPGTPQEEYPQRPSKFIAPSFLWASVQGAISFIDVSDTAKFEQKFAIEDIGLAPKGGDSLGQLNAGQLVLRGPLLFGSLINKFEIPQPVEWFLPGFKSGTKSLWATGRFRETADESGACFGHHIFYRDAIDDNTDQSLLCMLLFSATSQEDQTSYALILARDSYMTRRQSRTVYRRVGIITVIGKRCFDGRDEVRITIV